MPENIEFAIKDSTLNKMIGLKKEMGFDEKEWDEWFDHVFNSIQTKRENDIERVFEKLHYKQNYKDWIQNFAINLFDIWNERSARDLVPTTNSSYKREEHSAIVIGAGPSLKKHNHLELLTNSNYNGSIICTDRTLIPALKAGVTPDRFPKYYVVTIDPMEILKKFYDDEIIKTYGNKITGIFTTVVHPLTVGRAREAGIKIHWLHSLFDYHEGEKSFNQISGLMVRAKSHPNGLPAIQTGGNVGTSSWFIAWKILNCATVGLIGMNHGWDENDSWDEILSHANAPKDMDRNSNLFKKLYPKIYNPEFNCYCILDPIYQYYSSAFKEFISRSPSWVTTVNATEGGCIFGERVKCTTFEDFLQKYKN
jgi:hypothetical protein